MPKKKPAPAPETPKPDPTALYVTVEAHDGMIQIAHTTERWRRDRPYKLEISSRRGGEPSITMHLSETVLKQIEQQIFVLVRDVGLAKHLSKA